MSRIQSIVLRAALASAVVGLCSPPSPVHAAAGDRGSWELGLFGGYGFLDDYAGLDPDDDLLYGGRVGYFLTDGVSLETSFQQLATETDLGGVDFDITSSRLNALYNYKHGASFRPFLTAGLGFEATEFGTVDDTGPGINVGGGGRWLFGEHFGMRLDGRFVYTDVASGVDDWQGNFEATAGLVFGFGAGKSADSDGDGVRDAKDDCPDTPLGALVDEHGCPKDADGDGVYDGIDKCPDTPKGCVVDAAGCPKDSDGDGVIDCRDNCAGTSKECKVDATGCAPDADGDGVCDGSDTCPGTAKGCRVDAKGCPADEDGDGVCDGVDKCPGTTKGCRVDAVGCPVDEDADRVCDGVDRCPGTPAGRKVDERGCELAFDERGTLHLEGVNFAYNSDQLTPESTGVLDRVAASLAEWSELNVEVGGHTDAKGSDTYNQTLSQRRAETVRKYLIARGVAASRLTAKGYGESQPKADNANEEGRSRNRRVELRKLN